MNDILRPRAALEYSHYMRWVFPFPPGWNRLQSPSKHLGSYSLSEHARWSVIIPVLLRCFLKEHHVKPLLITAINNLQRRIEPSQVLSPVNFLVACFATIAKSHSQVTSNKSFDDTVEVVLRGRKMYKALMTAMVDAAEHNTRLAPSRQGSRAGSRAQTPVGQPPAGQATSQATGQASGQAAAVSYPPLFGPMPPPAAPVTNMTQLEKHRSVEYTAEASRPVVHVALHFSAYIREYGSAGHLIVFIGEDKHRYFKDVVYNTNHRGVEFALLMKENFRQTVRLVLANSFRSEENAAITRILQELNKNCPSLFASILPRSEQTAYKPDGDDDEDEMDIQPDNLHLRPLAIGSIPAKYCKETLNVPTRSSKLSDEFKSALAKAYAEDYHRPNIVGFSKKVLLWSKKFSFTDRYVVDTFDVVHIPFLVVFSIYCLHHICDLYLHLLMVVSSLVVADLSARAISTSLN